jgi:hypothetical protein
MLKVSAPGYRSIETELALSSVGVLSRDFRLISSSVHTGRAAISARVLDDSGRGMNTALASIPALSLQTRVDSGFASFALLPVGTWVVELRAIGFERAVVLIDADVHPSPTNISMSRLVTTLDAIEVVATRAANRRVLSEIDQRMRVAFGTLIREDNLSLRNAKLPSEAVAAARGFSYKGTTSYVARDGCRSASRADSLKRRGSKEIAIYLDGVRFPGGLQSVNDLVKPDDILAIEAYPDVTSAPFLWRTNDACAVIAFWTKR